MNRIIIYCFLLLLYLTLSKSLSPSELGISYLNSKENLATLVPGSPVSVILTDIHSTGFIIKTYYLKFKIVYGFQTKDELIVRTSRAFKEKYNPYIGMSIFRRYKDNDEISYTPLPPGSVFIGDKNFGSWKNHNSGDKIWKFFRIYRQIPSYLGWNNFLPTYDFYSKINIFKKQNKPFLGENKEFGINGRITRKAFPRYFDRLKPQSVDWKQFFRNYFQNNIIKTGTPNE